MAKKKNIKQILRKYITLLIEQFNIYSIVLFGSYAKGCPGKYSDIDIAVFSDSFGKDPLSEMTLLCKIRRKVDTDIEPLPFNKEDFFNHSKKDFIYDIVKNGKIIYKEGKILL